MATNDAAAEENDLGEQKVRGREWEETEFEENPFLLCLGDCRRSFTCKKKIIDDGKRSERQKQKGETKCARAQIELVVTWRVIKMKNFIHSYCVLPFASANVDAAKVERKNLFFYVLFSLQFAVKTRER